jgi:transmembrane sensor
VLEQYKEIRKNSMHERDAAEWFARWREGDLTEAEREQFTGWLMEAPYNVRMYLSTVETWGVLQASSWPAESKAHLLGVLRHGSEANVISLPRIDQPDRNVEPAHLASPARRRRRWAVINTIVAAALVSLGWYWIEARTTVYTTGRGEQRSIVLADGSVVQMNTLSTVAVHLDSSRRRVELRRGEAFFRVAHDSSRPFDVVTHFATVRAVGTEFDVYDRPDITSVTVVEGRVLVDSIINDTEPASASLNEPTLQSAGRPNHSAASHQAVPVAAGQKITVSPGLEFAPVPASANRATAWIERRVVLDNDRVDTAISEFNRYQATQMQVHGSDLAGLRISGVFDVDDPTSFVKYLKEIQRVNPRLVDGTLILER